MANASTHYSILAVDVEGYGRRIEAAQVSVRQIMYDCVQVAAQEAAISWPECVALDRGDSIILLVPPSIPPAILIDPFVARLEGLLRQRNMLSSAAAKVRMRVAVHAGYLQSDTTGWAGNAINTASRLLDAPVLRAALAAAERAQTALIVSDEVYRAVITQGHVGLDPVTFHSVQVAAKELDTTAWIHVPGYPDLPTAAPPPPPSEEPTAQPSVVITAGGDAVGGIAGGDIAGGDINRRSRIWPARPR